MKSLSSERVNIFVFGDLVLDHLIRLVNKAGPFQAAKEEQVYDALPRITTAGGAANCARCLAALSNGRTALWGLTGYSPWGTFSQVLLRSHIVDGATVPAVLYASHNESRHMNTITRAVRVEANGGLRRTLRMDDIPRVRPTAAQEGEALNSLKAEFDEYGVDAIILNDLDMNALSEGLVHAISDFASNKNIPMFIDPKRNWRKYRTIPSTCFLPNLHEWCYIVEDPDNEQYWRRSLSSEEHLRQMAIRSFRYIPGARSHVIKCDEGGSILILPGDGGIRHVLRIPPHSPSQDDSKLGSGDVLVAVLAMEYAAHDHGTDYERLLAAFHTANAVVACYRALDWQRMPNRRAMESVSVQVVPPQRRAVVDESILYLPEIETINIAAVSLYDSDLVSVDPTYRREIERMVRCLKEGWGQNEPRSAILTGRGGVGKSVMKAILERSLAPQRIKVVRVNDEHDLVGWKTTAWPKVDDAWSAIEEKWASEWEGVCDGLLIIIDETWATAGHLVKGEAGKMLLQGASPHARKTRFLFIDADWGRHRDEISESQFVNRCDVFSLPSLGERLWDVPYIFASGCYRALTKRGVSVFWISEAVLLAVTSWVIKEVGRESGFGPRTIIKEAGDIVGMLKEGETGGRWEISKRHLREELQREAVRGEKKLYRVEFDKAGESVVPRGFEVGRSAGRRGGEV